MSTLLIREHSPSWSPATTGTASCKAPTSTVRTASSSPSARDLDVSADEVIDGSHMLCYPGLVNTHHHLYQRVLPQPAAGAEHGAV
ncbi:MAG: hypothetical protein ACLUS6_00670 [Dysosmobacter sp.]